LIWRGASTVEDGNLEAKMGVEQKEKEKEKEKERYISTMETRKEGRMEGWID
jgi:hypothetical protein